MPHAATPDQLRRSYDGGRYLLGCQAARCQRADDLHWRKRFGGFQASEVRRLKQLEAENARLKKLVRDRGEKEVVQKPVSVRAHKINITLTMRRRSGVINGHPIVILAVERLSGPATAPPPREPFSWPRG